MKGSLQTRTTVEISYTANTKSPFAGLIVVARSSNIGNVCAFGAQYYHQNGAVGSDQGGAFASRLP
jgi:hypothetical protein